MRRASRVDANQATIVNYVRALGGDVLLLHAVGGGCPDVLIHYRGKYHLCEIKDGSKPPSERRLNPVQVAFHAKWRGPILVITSIEDVATMIVNHSGRG